MIKRRNWAVTRGGGEYGSEDSSDSDLEEEERQIAGVREVAPLSWAEAITAMEQADSEEEHEMYADVALRGPTQTAAIGGFRGRSFARESEGDGGASSEGEDGDEDEDEDGDEATRARVAAGETLTESQRRAKRGAAQREARRRKARQRGAAKKVAAEGAQGESGQDGGQQEEEPEEPEDEEAAAKKRRKYEGFAKKEAAKAAYTAPNGKTMYRSPLFPDMQIFSVEQLRHHMMSKRYKKAARQARAEAKAKKSKNKSSAEPGDAQDEATQKADSAGTGAAKDGGKKKKRKAPVGSSQSLSAEQIAARKAKFAAKKERRKARAAEAAAAARELGAPPSAG